MSTDPNKIDWSKHPDVAMAEGFKTFAAMAGIALVIFVAGVSVGAFAQWARGC